MERFFNSGRFEKTLQYLIKAFSSPFDFFEKLSGYFKACGYFKRSLSGRDLYTVILNFARDGKLNVDLKMVNELLKFDFLASNNTNNLPAGLVRNMEPCFKEKCFEFLKREEYISEYIPDFAGLPAKQIYTKVHFERFQYDVTKDNITQESTVILFDYTHYNSVKSRYKYMKVPVC